MSKQLIVPGRIEVAANAVAAAAEFDTYASTSDGDSPTLFNALYYLRREVAEKAWIVGETGSFFIEGGEEDD